MNNYPVEVELPDPADEPLTLPLTRDNAPEVSSLDAELFGRLVDTRETAGLGSSRGGGHAGFIVVY
jgi:hypothetical protein